MIAEASETNNTMEATGTITVSMPGPAIPTGLTATGGTRQISLAWTPSAGATGYVVLRSPAAGGPFSSIETPAATSYVDGGLEDGATSGNSSSASATTIPAPPVNLVASTGSKRGQVGLRWSAATGATGYTVLRASASGGTYSQAGTPNGTTFTDGNLTSGVRYYYVVRSRNAAGTSADSAEASALAR